MKTIFKIYEVTAKFAGRPRHAAQVANTALTLGREKTIATLEGAFSTEVLPEWLKLSEAWKREAGAYTRETDADLSFEAVETIIEKDSRGRVTRKEAKLPKWEARALVLMRYEIVGRHPAESELVDYVAEPAELTAAGMRRAR